ncbi:MAG TPA: polyprenyl synthetase family protein [Acidimicrobiales bacterium]|nr:polyprenyl synthetase family protein [Acidimicrobiales bacterium]
MRAAPASLTLIADRVEQRLRTLLEVETERWRALDEEIVAPLESLRALLLAGGKRLRPAFCHWGFVGAGGDPDDPVVADAGAAFELLHAFALIHDDVMDGSSTRRGARTAHLDYSDRHEVEGWRGEPRRFGEGVAILLGDLAFVYADQYLPASNAEAMAVWHELRIELNIGQYLDIVGTARGQTNRVAAERIARYKSGKYTVERPLHLGAALAGRFGELAPALSAYGLPLGDAFQLRDDMLGAFGESSLTGKPVGDDLREGKPTPMLAIAASRADKQHAELLHRVGAPDLDEQEVAALQAVIVDTGAQAEAEAAITALTDQAVRAIERAPIAGLARDELVELAYYVAWRQR